MSTTVDLIAVIDVAGEPELAERALNDELNHAECAECDGKLQAERPVVVFDWEAQAVFLLLGRKQRHQGIREIAAYMTRLSDSAQGEALPGFASRPTLAFGGLGLASAREGLERERVVVSAGAAEALEGAREALEQDRREVEIRAAELEQREEQISAREKAADDRFEDLGARTDELKVIEGELEAKGEQVLDAEREIEAKEQALDEVRRSLERNAMEVAAAAAQGAKLEVEVGGDDAQAEGEEGADERATDSADDLEASEAGEPEGDEGADEEADGEGDDAQADDDDAEESQQDGEAEEAEESEAADAGDDAEEARESEGPAPPEPPDPPDPPEPPDPPAPPEEAAAADEGAPEGGDPERAESWDPELDSEWVLDGEGKAADTVATGAVGAVDGAEPQAGDDDERTVRFQIGEDGRPTESKEVEVLAPRPAVGPFPSFDADLAGESERYWVVDEGELYLCLRQPEDALGRLLGERLDLRFQLHRPDQGAVAALTLVTITGAGEQVEAVWSFDPAKDSDRKVLNVLADTFKPLLVLFDEDGDPQRLLPFERPLEDNVVVGLDRAESWVDGQDRAGFHAAVEVITADSYELLGAKVHPFHSEAFHHIGDAGRTRFAVNVVEYWSSVDNRDYLLLIKSFPAAELRELVRRTVLAAVEFGVALGEGLTERALAIEAAGSRRELVQSQLASFAEVALRLKPGGLDDVGEWENWESLLGQAEECGVAVDSSILGLAESAMDRVKQLMDGGGRPEAPASTGENKMATPPPPPPASSADPGRPPGMQRSDVTQEIDPDLDAELFLDSEDEEAELADRSAKELVALLDGEPAEVAQAAMAIVARGDRELADALVARVRADDDGKGRTQALECLASLGEVAVAAVTEGVKSRKRGDESLDDAVAVLVRAVGKARVERMKRDRSRKVRDAARRVLKRLADGQTDPGTREQEAVANAFLASGGAESPEEQEDASA